MRNPLHTPARLASLRDAVLCLAPVGMLGAVAPAQVPENSVVVGTVIYNNAPGTSGVFLVTLPLPTATSKGGQITPLTGLPAALTVRSGPGVFGGCFSVLHRSTDGTLFAGDGAASGGNVHVHILTLAGAKVMNSRSVLVGQVPPTPLNNTRRVGGMTLLPDGRVVIVADLGLTGGPMAGSPIAILDDKATPPTLTPVRLSANPQGGFIYAVAVTPDGTTAYIITQTSQARFVPGRLYSIDLTSGTTATPHLLHTWPNGLLTHMTALRDGILYATRLDPVAGSSPSIEQITVKGASAVVKSVPVSTNTPVVGPVFVRATGQFVFGSAIWPNTQNNASVLMGDSGGTLSLLAGPPTGGWGMPMAIDINDAFETYGLTRGQDRHWFEDFPNPGGLPEVGNQKFSLTLRSKTAPLATFLVVGQRRDFPFMGIRVLAQPTTVVPLAPGTTVPFAAGIPNDPTLRDLSVSVQGVHLERGGAWAATRGLELSIR